MFPSIVDQLVSASLGPVKLHQPCLVNGNWSCLIPVLVIVLNFLITLEESFIYLSNHLRVVIEKIHLKDQLFLILPALGLRCCEGFSLVVASGGYSSCRAQASHCSGFCCGAQVLGRVGFGSCGSQTLKHRFSTCGTWA